MRPEVDPSSPLSKLLVKCAYGGAAFLVIYMLYLGMTGQQPKSRYGNSVPVKTQAELQHERATYDALKKDLEQR